MEVATHVRVLRKVPAGVNPLRPPHDVKVVGVEDELIRLVQVTGSNREQECKHNTEPEVWSGP